MRIGIAFDLVPTEPHDGPDDLYEDFDTADTVEMLGSVLAADGHEVVALGDGPELVKALVGDPVDLVWNMARGVGQSRARESRVPGALELLGIPYVGSDPVAVGLACDKLMAKRIVSAEHIPVPFGAFFPPETPDEAVSQWFREYFRKPTAEPLVLKPSLEGAGRGIRADAVVNRPSQAIALYERLKQQFAQTILAEPYVYGDEFTVAVLGQGSSARVLGMMRIHPAEPAEWFIYDLDCRRNRTTHVVYEAPPRLETTVRQSIELAALTCHAAIGCRDVARYDIRLKDGIPYFLDANPIPDLSPRDSDMAILAKGHGLDYRGLIRLILKEAMGRLKYGGVG